MITSHSGQLMLSSKCLTMQLLQKVCKHSVTVVASTRYPEQILQVIISLMLQILIFLSPAETAAIAAAGSPLIFNCLNLVLVWKVLSVYKSLVEVNQANI